MQYRTITIGVLFLISLATCKRRQTSTAGQVKSYADIDPFRVVTGSPCHPLPKLSSEEKTQFGLDEKEDVINPVLCDDPGLKKPLFFYANSQPAVDEEKLKYLERKVDPYVYARSRIWFLVKDNGIWQRGGPDGPQTKLHPVFTFLEEGYGPMVELDSRGFKTFPKIASNHFGRIIPVIDLYGNLNVYTSFPDYSLYGRALGGGYSPITTLFSDPTSEVERSKDGPVDMRKKYVSEFQTAGSSRYGREYETGWRKIYYSIFDTETGALKYSDKPYTRNKSQSISHQLEHTKYTRDLIAFVNEKGGNEVAGFELVFMRPDPVLQVQMAAGGDYDLSAASIDVSDGTKNEEKLVSLPKTRKLSMTKKAQGVDDVGKWGTGWGGWLPANEVNANIFLFKDDGTVRSEGSTNGSLRGFEVPLTKIGAFVRNYGKAATSNRPTGGSHYDFRLYRLRHHYQLLETDVNEEKSKPNLPPFKFKETYMTEDVAVEPMDFSHVDDAHPENTPVIAKSWFCVCVETPKERQAGNYPKGQEHKKCQDLSSEGKSALARLEKTDFEEAREHHSKNFAFIFELRDNADQKSYAVLRRNWGAKTAKEKHEKGGCNYSGERNQQSIKKSDQPCWDWEGGGDEGWKKLPQSAACVEN